MKFQIGVSRRSTPVCGAPHTEIGGGNVHFTGLVQDVKTSTFWVNNNGLMMYTHDYRL